MSARGLIGATLGTLLVTGAVAPAALAEGSGRRAAARSEWAPDAYVLSEGNTSWCTSASVEGILAIQARLKGSFLWARRGGKEYVVREAETLEQAQSVFARLQHYDPEREELARKQARLEAERDALESQQEAIDQDLDAIGDESDRSDRDSERRSLERRRQDVESRLRSLEGREADLNAKEEAFDARDDAMEAQAEAELWRLIDRSIASGVARQLPGPAAAE